MLDDMDRADDLAKGQQISACLLKHWATPARSAQIIATARARATLKSARKDANALPASGPTVYSPR
jgi:hypothetical protein